MVCEVSNHIIMKKPNFDLELLLILKQDLKRFRKRMEKAA
jgi:hypothetical protein